MELACSVQLAFSVQSPRDELKSRSVFPCLSNQLLTSRRLPDLLRCLVRCWLVRCWLVRCWLVRCWLVRCWLVRLVGSVLVGSEVTLSPDESVSESAGVSGFSVTSAVLGAPSSAMAAAESAFDTGFESPDTAGFVSPDTAGVSGKSWPNVGEVQNKATSELRKMSFEVVFMLKKPLRKRNNVPGRHSNLKNCLGSREIALGTTRTGSRTLICLGTPDEAGSSANLGSFRKPFCLEFPRDGKFRHPQTCREIVQNRQPLEFAGQSPCAAFSRLVTLATRRSPFSVEMRTPFAALLSLSRRGRIASASARAMWTEGSSGLLRFSFYGGTSYALIVNRTGHAR